MKQSITYSLKKSSQKKDKDLKYVIVQDNRYVLIVCDNGNVKDLIYCSKVFSKLDKAEKAIKKIKDLEMTHEELTSQTKLEIRPTYKFKYSQKRYQDKRKTEKMFSQYKADTYKGSQPHIIESLKNKRELELLVPVDLVVDNKKTVYWVRESKILSKKWIDKIGYEKASFLLLRVKNTLKKTPEVLLTTPNKEYILSLS